MRNRQVKQFKHLIEDELAVRTVTSTGAVLPIGYNPIEHIRGALFHWVAVPFNGIDIWCELRCPNGVQLQSCGDYTNIVGDGEPEKYTNEQILNLRNIQENISKLVLNRPAYDEIAKLVDRDDFVISDKRKKLDDLERRFDENKNSMLEDERLTIETEIESLKMEIGYFLPFDTMTFLTNWANGNDVADIKKITKEKYLQAASLARASNKAPTDYLSGVFTDFNKSEIDAHAFTVLEEFLKEKELVANASHVWKGAMVEKDG